MENIVKEFFKSWENEIVSYQEILICLTDQKAALIEWNIRKFQKASQQTAIAISRAHRSTITRNDLMETLFVMNDLSLTENNLKTVAKVFTQSEDAERAEILCATFVNTVKKIDTLSTENKELIKTGLELVGENLEMIADMIDKDRIYSRVGIMPAKRSAILLNTKV